MTIDFTPELIGGLVGAVLSWLFAWFPGLRTWFAALKPEVKSGIMLGLLGVVSGTVYILAQTGVIILTAPVTALRLFTIFFMASTINQTAYSLTPQSADVKEIKTVEVIKEIKKVEPEAIVIEPPEDCKPVG